MNKNFFGASPNGRRTVGGRPYGWDNFSKVMILIGITMLLGGFELKILGLIIIGFAFYRSISRNIIARRREGLFFDNLINNGAKYITSAKKNVFKGKKASKFNNPIINIRDRMKNTIVKCPFCSQKLRLPRGKGNIIVTCATCKKEFKIKTW